MKKHILFFLGALCLLSGCVTPSPRLYQWEGYQLNIYEYFQNPDASAQIDKLTQGLEKIHANGNTPPPGYYAHLGLLYAQTGQYDKMALQFQEEKRLFPESAVYMDFLMNNAQKMGEKKAKEDKGGQS